MRVGFVTDIHWNREPGAAGGWHHQHEFAGVPDRLGRALGWFAERDVDIVAIGGDLVHGGDAESVVEVLELASRIAAPVVLVSGNHDVTGGADLLAAALRRSEVSGVTLLGGGGIRYEGVCLAGVHVGETDGWFGARLCEPLRTSEWSPGPAVLISHFPVFSRAQFLSDRGFAYPGDLLDRGEIAAELLDRKEPTIVLSGHIHARDTWTEGPVLQFSQGALVEAPFECGLLEIELGDDGTLRARRESARIAISSEAREPVFSPDREAWRFDERRWRSLTEDLAPADGHELAAVDPASQLNS